MSRNDQKIGYQPSVSRYRNKGALKRFVLKLALIAGILYIGFVYVFGVHIHSGNRMYPFVMDGDLVILYRLDTYRMNDVVLYRNPVTGKADISRVAAIGENEINKTDTGELTINGYTVNDNAFYPTEALEESGIQFPYQMNMNGYFLLDDNRPQGNDSRTFGEVKRSDILGKVIYVLRRRGI